jgi:hypothetical protein
MPQPMDEFMAAFRPLAEGVRANADDDALRPYVGPVHYAIRGLAQPDLDAALRLTAELAGSAPFPAAGLAALLCGAIVECGGSVDIAAPAVLAAARRAFRTAAEQQSAIRTAWQQAEEAKGSRPSDAEFRAIAERASAAFSPEDRGTLIRLPLFSDALCVVMERSKEVRKAVRRDRGFVDDVWSFRDQGTDTPALVSKLLAVLDDADLLVLHPLARRGYFVRVAGICHNFQFHTLLADALIGDPAAGWLSGRRPDSRVAAMARDQPFDPDAPPAEASFHLQTWHAIRPDGTHDTDPAAFALWHEGTPADIPRIEGMPVVVLSPVTVPRTWRVPRTWPEMVGELAVVGKLSPEQVDQAVKALARLPRDEDTAGRGSGG